MLSDFIHEKVVSNDHWPSQNNHMDPFLPKIFKKMFCVRIVLFSSLHTTNTVKPLI